jgi:hypothetical protein
MYKIAALGMLGVLVILLIPASSDASTPISPFYGSATLMLLDEYGQEKFSQTVHNQIFDLGETFLLQQVFQDGTTAVADAIQIGAICAMEGTVPTSESTGLSTAVSANTSTNSAKCMTDTAVAIASSVATIEVTFTTGTNWDSGETITGIYVCAAHTSNTAVADCATTLFAVVDTSNVTPTSTETVTVTYKFDISSGST